MSLIQMPPMVEDNLSRLSQMPWTRAAAAGSLIAGALLLINGKKGAAVAAAAAGAALLVLENPAAAQELWDRLPRYVRQTQDMLVRVEGLVEEVAAQGEKLKRTLVHG